MHSELDFIIPLPPAAGKQNFLELSQRHNSKRGELAAAVFIAEQSLYLLWLHLDFYLRNAVIYAQENRNAINESYLGKQEGGGRKGSASLGGRRREIRQKGNPFLSAG